jgi:uncharacterized surface protein with fasciclin (FAS1) repeats
MKFNAVSFSKAAIAGTMLAFSALASAADVAEQAGRDVLSVAKQKGSFNTLTKAIEVAGLQDVLKAQGPVTLFAPTDEAFAKLPPGQLEELLKPENKEQLVKILTYHVVPGQAIEKDAMKRSRGAETAAGDTVKFGLVNGRVRVDDARVTADYDAANGIVHAVDRVLIPN